MFRYLRTLRRLSVAAGALVVALASVSVAWAVGTSQLNNGHLRFVRTATGSDGTSAAPNGMLEQPFYKNGSSWRPLTFSNYGLDIAIGVGTGAGWHGSTVTHFDARTDVSPTVDESNFVVGTAGTPNLGYGSIVTSGVYSLSGGVKVSFSHKWELGQNDSYIKVTTTIGNNVAGQSGSLSNLRVWVGTKDDYVGQTDAPIKERGNIPSDGFVRATNQSDATSAIRIKTADEGVLFYSTTPGVQTSVASCCSFSNVYSVAPRDAPTIIGDSTYHDGSYAIILPVGSLNYGQTAELVWYYAAAPLSELDAAVAAVAAAAQAGLDNVTTSGGDLTYEFSEDGMTYWVVVADGATAPTAAQIKAATDYGSETILASGSGAVDANTERTFAITGLSESSDYVVYVATEYDDDADPGTPDNLSSVESTSFSTAPGIPTASVTAGNGQVSVAITPSNTADNFEYSTDGGTNWVTRAPASTSSPWTISSLTNGTAYPFTFRSVYGGNAGGATSAISATPATVPSYTAAPAITGDAKSGATLTGADGTWNNGGAAVTATSYQWISVSGGVDSNISGATSSTLCVPVSLVGSTIKLKVTKTNSQGSTSATSSPTAAVTSDGTCVVATTTTTTTRTTTPTVVVPPVVIPAVPPRVTTTPGTAVPVVQSGPVLTRGVVPVPPKAPTVVLGGRPTLMSVTVPTTTQLDVKAGRLSLGVKVLEDQGTISEAPDGTTQIAVKKGASATITGTGFKPAATVQVFLPLDGDNAKELTRIPVAADGSFDGSAPFATKANEAPLPVGKQVLQLVSLDNDGNQVVVEMTVNIAQGAPAPEANRIEGVIPAMQPGQSIATSGGEPVPVTITPVSDQKLAVVEGDGWSMAVNVNSDQGGVEPAEGGALLKLVRNESALVSGSGFMAGTRADVWLFSDPTLLGTVTIDENGEFTGEVNIDPNMIPVGQHTLQLQGVGEDGYVKAANMGVLVDDPAEAVTDTATASLTFLWWILAAVLAVLVLVVLLVSRRRRQA